MKYLTLQNLYTGGHRVKEVENDYPVRMGEVISFDGDITDKDYRLYRVVNILEGKKVKLM